jgi:hypothetical protein
MRISILQEYAMPDPKDKAKMTGDTHLPDVESDMPFHEGSADALGMDGTPRDRGQAKERGDQKRPGRGAKKAGVLKDQDAKTSESGEGSGPDKG